MKSGIIAIQKPCGISSARVVARVKKALNVKKVGHTGTLDPFATGLMLCAVNKGTKISRFFLGGNKKYTARVCLGIETDTYDLTGKTVFTATQRAISSLTREDIENAVNFFKGPQEQIPPCFSALKHKGVPLYKLARQGKKIEKPARQIEIFDIRITNIELPHVDIEVLCSSGTYIRSIAFDLGKKLGCGGHLSKLCRTGSGAFKLEDAIELEAFEKLDKKTAMQKIVSLSDCLDFMPKISVNQTIAQKIKFGQKLFKDSMDSSQEQSLPKPGKFIRAVDRDNNLLAIIQLAENTQEYNYSCVFSS